MSKRRNVANTSGLQPYIKKHHSLLNVSDNNINDAQTLPVIHSPLSRLSTVSTSLPPSSSISSPLSSSFYQPPDPPSYPPFNPHSESSFSVKQGIGSHTMSGNDTATAAAINNDLTVSANDGAPPGYHARIKIISEQSEDISRKTPKLFRKVCRRQNLNRKNLSRLNPAEVIEEIDWLKCQSTVQLRFDCHGRVDNATHHELIHVFSVWNVRGLFDGWDFDFHFDPQNGGKAKANRGGGLGQWKKKNGNFPIWEFCDYKEVGCGGGRDGNRGGGEDTDRDIGIEGERHRDEDDNDDDNADDAVAAETNREPGREKAEAEADDEPHAEEAETERSEALAEQEVKVNTDKKALSKLFHDIVDEATMDELKLLAKELIYRKLPTRPLDFNDQVPLPVEVFGKVLSYLPVCAVLTSSVRVCKGWFKATGK